MTAVVTAMILVLAIVGIVVGVVLVGLQGRGADRAPVLADRMARAGAHLNGDGTPPRAFVRVLRGLHLNVQ